MQLMVLGMHRSGTSALARVLNLMGVYFGPEGISTGANEENPKGFWERRDVRALNDSTLHAVGCDWDRVSAFDAGSLPGSVAEEFRTRGSKLILEMDAHRPWFIKEPRLCLLLPLWLQLLEAPVCIHIHRHPVEVAASLLTRNEMPMPVGLALWEKYVSSALAASAGLPAVNVSHHKLMTDPMPEVERLFVALVESGVPGLRMPSNRELGAFIDPKLYRERSSHKELREFAQASQVEMFKTVEAGLSQAQSIIAKPSQETIARLAAYESLLPALQLKPAAPVSSDAVLREKVVARDQENKLLREAIAQRETELRNREEQHTHDSVALGQLQSTVTHYEREITAAQARIDALTSELRNRDDRLSDQASVLEELRGNLARLEAEATISQNTHAAVIRESEIALHKAERSTEERFREIAKLSRRLLEQEDALRKAAATQAATIASLESRTRELDAAQQALAGIRGSRIWKLSAPLRAMSRALGRPAKSDVPDLKSAIATIESSGLFDRNWYLSKYEDVARSGMDPLEHYLRFGAMEERNPGAGFDTASYLKRNPDVRGSGINPLLHYASHGKSEGRLPK